MRIGVISDSHDRLPTLEAAVALLLRREIDVLLHPGDFIAPFAAKRIAPPFVPDSVPVHCVYGNNDGERAGLARVLPQVVDGPLRVELAGRVFVMHHFIDWLGADDLAGADAVVTGHTHEVVNETRDGVLYLNPGECCGWLTGRCTCAIVETDTMTAEVIDVTPA